MTRPPDTHPTPADDPRPRLAVFVSGTGRSLENLIAHDRDASLRARVALVVASRPCPAAEIARDAAIPTVVQTAALNADDLERLLDEHRIDAAALAGYIKHLPVPTAYAGRILNIHPALLPAHGGPGMYGRCVHAAVLDAGDTESGCTVHLVNDQYDAGPIIAQARCPVRPGDAPDTLAARVFELEKQLYPQAINQHLAQARR